MKTPFVIALAWVAALAGTTIATDVALAAPPPPDLMTWTGFYLGANAGVVTQWNTVQDTNSWAGEGLLNVSSKNIGGTVGGQAGYNIQDGNFVYGVEADWNWTSTKSDKTLSDACVCGGMTVVQVHSEMDWVATARGRAGLAVGSTLAYVTAGAALAGFNNHWGAGLSDPFAVCGGPPACGFPSDNNFVSHNTRLGWAAGFGIEHMFAAYPHLTVKVEAMWLDFANNIARNPGPSLVSGAPGPFASQFQNQAALARVGLNYKY